VLTFVLRDGQIATQFRNTPPRRKRVAIVGGTGAYRGGSGQLALVERPNQTGTAGNRPESRRCLAQRLIMARSHGGSIAVQSDPARALMAVGVAGGRPANVPDVGAPRVAAQGLVAQTAEDLIA
jgi:hypothetical protein